MRRVGLSQRVEVVPGYGERRDCLDQNWARFVLEAGFLPVPLSNAVTEVGAYLSALGLAGVVLTGGNDVASVEGARNPAPERDRFETALIAACRQFRLPVLGVCRGLQLLNLECGGRLDRVEGHVATRHLVSLEGRPMEVNSYHGLAIPADGLGSDLQPVARCEDGTVEAARHPTAGWWGVMWHPERERPFREWDLRLLRELFGAEAGDRQR